SQLYKYRRETDKEQKKRDELIKQEAALYKRGLEAIPQTKHFRQIKDNMARAYYFRELFLLDLDAAVTSRENTKKKEALASAESWVNQLKKEVSADSLQVRFMNASLLNARGELIAATK